MKIYLANIVAYAIACLPFISLMQNALTLPEKSDADVFEIEQESEKDDGWISLFDGKSTQGWRDFKGQTVSAESWQVKDGCLVSGKVPGDIVTNEKYSSFELQFQWKVTNGANSGVFYRVQENAAQIHEAGLEYQVLDNIGQAGRPATEQAAASYGIIGPEQDLTKPTGKWNDGKIVVKGNQVHHYLNGKQVVHFEIGSKDYTQRVAAGPLRNHADLAKTPRGHIALQNYHGHKVWFRKIRIRNLGNP